MSPWKVATWHLLRTCMHPRITAWLALKGRKRGDKSGASRFCCTLYFSQSFVKGLTVSPWKVATLASFKDMDGSAYNMRGWL